MEASQTQVSMLVGRDLVGHFQSKYEEQSRVRERLQSEVESKHGELANERRMRHWLESRLEQVVHALATTDATRKYREEVRSEGVTRGILDLVQADLANERRLRGKLEETVRVMERAQTVEQYKRKIEQQEKAVGTLRGTLETTQTELTKEQEMVRVLEATVADLERPIMEDLEPRDEGGLAELEGIRSEFLDVCRARQGLERKLIELEEAMSWEQLGREPMSRDSAMTLERIQDELSVERKLRERLEKKLRNEEASRAEQKQEERKDEDNMLQNLLKCTLDKLSNERRVRRTLEERLAVLEQAVEKEQAKTKFEEIFLELTQNELTEEREARLILEKQLAELEGADEARKMADAKDSGEYFDAKLEALDKIITSIQEQNQHEQDEIDEGGGQGAAKDEKEAFANVSAASEQADALTQELGASEEDLVWHKVVTDDSDSSTVNGVVRDDYHELVMRECMEKFFEEVPVKVEPMLDELARPEMIVCEDNDRGRWQILGELIRNPYEVEEQATRETEMIEEERNDLLFKMELEPYDNTLVEFATQSQVNNTEENIERNIFDAAQDIEPVIFAMDWPVKPEEKLAELNGGTTSHGGDLNGKQLVLAKLVGNEDQVLEDKLEALGAIKKQIEKQPDTQQTKEDELPSVYE